jgi:hypothetical protein
MFCLQREKSFFIIHPSNNKACRFFHLSQLCASYFSRGHFFFNSDNKIKSCNPREHFDGEEGLWLEQQKRKGQIYILEAEIIIRR